MNPFIPRLALAFGLAATGLARPAQAQEAAPPESPLTFDETALSRGIFGGMLDADIVRKVMQPLRCGDDPDDPPAAFVRLGDGVHVNFCGFDNHASDYARGGPLFALELVHEMTHIVQGQKRFAFTFGTLKGAKKLEDYSYLLSPHKPFKAFGAEQQAQMVEDYAGVTFYGLPLSSECRNPHDVATVGLLQKTVETMFPAARKTRLAFEATPAGMQVRGDVEFALGDETLRARFPLKEREGLLWSLSEKFAPTRYTVGRPFYMYSHDQQDAIEKDYIAVVAKGPLSPNCASPDTPATRRELAQAVEKGMPGAAEVKRKTLKALEEIARQPHHGFFRAKAR